MKELSYQALKTERELARLSAEMREFKNSSELDRREMNRKWGEIANKMGTLVEDVVAPKCRGNGMLIFPWPRNNETQIGREYWQKGR